MARQTPSTGTGNGATLPAAIAIASSTRAPTPTTSTAAAVANASASVVSRTGATATGRTTPISISGSSMQQRAAVNGNTPGASAVLVGANGDGSMNGQHSHHHHHRHHHHHHPHTLNGHAPSTMIVPSGSPDSHLHAQSQSHSQSHSHSHPRSNANANANGHPPQSGIPPAVSPDIHAHSQSHTTLHPVHGQPPLSSGGPPMGGTAESHSDAVRWVIQKGAALNAAAAQEQGYSIERHRLLPPTLNKLESETEGCFAELASIAWSMGDADRALASYQDALRRNPLHLVALQGMARYFKEAEKWQLAVDFAARALAVDEVGNEGEMWSIVGHALLFMNALQKAYSCYQQAIARAVKKNDPKLWYGIGILYDRYGSMEHAEEAFAGVLSLDPNFAKRDEVYFRLGIIYKLQGRADASLECFHYILADPPPPLNQVDVWYQIGHALELKKDLVAARDAYERVLRTTPDHSKVLQHLGGIYLRENTQFHDPEKCIGYITQSLEYDSQDPFSWYLLGRAFMQLNNYGKAYEAYQQAVYRDGKNSAYWCSIGVLYFNIVQFHDALDAYTRAVRIHPWIPEIWQNLGCLYENCNDQLADATDAYYRAYRLDPTNTVIANRLNELRLALETGREVASPPPAPLDIMPDSKSWAMIHFDLAGAKPVFDPKSTAPLGAESSTPPEQIEGRLMLASPPAYSATVGVPGPSGTYPPPRHPVNGGRRESFSRPGSSQSAVVAAGYPPHYAQAPVDDRRYPGMSSRVLAPMDVDRDPSSRRVAPAPRPGYDHSPGHEPPRYRPILPHSPPLSPRPRQMPDHDENGRPPSYGYPPEMDVDYQERMRGKVATTQDGRHAAEAQRSTHHMHSPPLHSPAHGRDYPQHASMHRRPPSPGMSRYDDRDHPIGAGGSLQPRVGGNANGHPIHYAHDYYSAPPSAGPGHGRAPAGAYGYPPDARRYDPRYDAAMDPREREIMYEREMQAHRTMEEEAIRRRELENSRREISPGGAHTAVDTPDRRQPGQSSSGRAGQGAGSRKSTAKSPGAYHGHEDQSALTDAPAPPPHQVTSGRKRKVVGGVAGESAAARRRNDAGAAGSSRNQARPPVGRPHSPSIEPLPIAASQHDTSRPEEDYDDEDTAAALIGLAGFSSSKAPRPAQEADQVRAQGAQLKRPNEAGDEQPAKKAKSEDERPIRPSVGS